MFCCFLVGVHDGQTFERAGRTMVLFDNERSMRGFIDNIRTLNITYTNNLRDAMIERLRGAGIQVNDNIEEGRFVLESFSKKSAVSERNELSAAEKDTQQKTWRTVYQSLSEVVSSSDMPRHTDVPGTLAVNKSLSGANLQRNTEIAKIKLN